MGGALVIDHRPDHAHPRIIANSANRARAQRFCTWYEVEDLAAVSIVSRARPYSEYALSKLSVVFSVTPGEYVYGCCELLYEIIKSPHYIGVKS